MSVIPAALAQLITNQSVDFQNLAYALYDLIAVIPGGDVSGPSSSVNLNIAVFNGTTGKIIKDGGMTIAQIIATVTAGTVVGPVGAVADNLPSFNGVTGLIIKDSGVSALSVVVGPGSATNLNIAVYDGTTGKLIKDGAQTIAQVIAAAVAASGNVVGPGSATNLNIAVYDGTTGKLIKDGAQTIAQVIAAAVAASGNVVGPGSAVNLNLCEFDGTTGKLIKDSGLLASAIVVGPASAVDGHIAVFDGTTGKLIKDGGAPSTGGLVQASSVKLTSGDITTSSTTFVDLAGVTVTITTGAHRCMINLILNTNNNATFNNFFDLLIDGVAVGGSNGLIFWGGTATSTSINAVLTFSFLTDVLSAASHTFKIQWKVGGGTGQVRASSTSPAIFQVIETNLTV